MPVLLEIKRFSRKFWFLPSLKRLKSIYQNTIVFQELTFIKKFFSCFWNICLTWTALLARKKRSSGVSGLYSLVRMAPFPASCALNSSESSSEVLMRRRLSWAMLWLPLTSPRRSGRRWRLHRASARHTYFRRWSKHRWFRLVHLQIPLTGLMRMKGDTAHFFPSVTSDICFMADRCKNVFKVFWVKHRESRLDEVQAGVE